MANTEIRLIIFFAAKDGEALYSQQKQDQELTGAQIMTHKIHPFKVYNPTVFGIFTMLCNCHHSLILDFFHHHKIKPRTY